MAEIVLDVSARLKVLLSSVAEMLKVLDKLQPNSSGFKALSNIIENIKKDMDKLLLLASKPFGSQALFNQAEKSIDKIEESLGKAQLAIQRILFSDLLLDSSQKAQFDALAQSLKDIENNFKQVKEAAKMDMFSNEDFANFANSISPDLINKSFDEVVKAIENKSNKINESLALSLRNIEKYNQTMSTGVKVKDFISGGFLKKGLGTDVFDEFLKKTENGLQFKKGKKEGFYQYMKDTFSLTPALMAEIAGKSANELLEYLSKAFDKKGNSTFFSKLLKALATAEKNYIEELGGLGQKKAEAEAAAQAMRVYRAEMVEVNKAESEAVAKTEQTTGEIHKLESSCVNAAKGSASLKDGFNSGQAALDLFRQLLAETNTLFLKLLRSLQTFNSMKMAIANFMGFNLVLNITKRAVQEAMNHIKELDSVMNGIAIVTDMSTGDLWNQVDAYSDMALKYGVTIQGAYDVSKIYYQQGLETADVMTLTNETLKLSKISGLDYATTTDYMTTAIRGFKMEMSEASKVVDVYSALAANTAVSLQELAEAMTRTASSMEGVGTTFLDASAMIATIVAVTRESANNIGSAMKSIASRYGELTKDPAKLMDSEGEAMSFNRVDTALQSVGISMKTAEGQFRDFTSVIVELAEKWNTLESTQQRYIATLFAGNRQQSRFLALVSNADLLKANMDVAANSEDTGTLQALKALDSIESKLNLVQVAYQLFYTTIGVENVWKGLLDGTKNVINTLNGLPKLFGKIPVAALGPIISGISLIKSLATNVLSGIAHLWVELMSAAISDSVSVATAGAKQTGDSWISNLINSIRGGAPAIQQSMQEVLSPNTNLDVDKKLSNQTLSSFKDIQDFKTLGADPVGIIGQYHELYESMLHIGEIAPEIALQVKEGELQESLAVEATIRAYLLKALAIELNTSAQASSMTGIKKLATEHLHLAGSMQLLGNAISMISMLFNTTTSGGRTAASAFLLAAGGVLLFSAALKIADSTTKSIPWMAIASGILSIVNAVSLMIETPELTLERLTKRAEELNNKAKEVKSNYNILDRGVKKLEELESKRYESAEAAKEYLTAVDELADKFPEMIAGFDEAGNIILDTTSAEEILARAREKSALAAYDAAEADLAAAKAKLLSAKQNITEPTNLETVSLSDSNNSKTQERKKFLTSGLFEQFALNDAIKSADSIDYVAFFDYLSTLLSALTADERKEFSFFDTILDLTIEQEGTIEDFRNNLLLYFNTRGENLSEIEKQLFSAITEDASSSNLDIEELNSLINQIKDVEGGITSNKGIELYKQLGAKYQEITNSSYVTPEMLESLEGVEAFLTSNNEAMADFIPLSDIYKGYERAVVSAWQNATQNTKKIWEYLTESPNLAAIITKQIIKDFEGQEINKDNIEQKAKLEQYQQAMEDFYTKLSPTNQDLLNKMLVDTDNFSAVDIIKQFNIVEGTDVYNLIINYYNDIVNQIRTRLENNLKEKYRVDFNKLSPENTDFISSYALLIHNEENKFTKTEEAFLNSILSQYDSLNSQGYTQRAENFGAAALGLFKKINTAPADIEKILWGTINENGLETIEGIEEIKSTIENNSLLKTAIGSEGLEFLDLVQQNIIPNINLAIQTATSNLLDTWEDTSKELTKSMSGGVTLKEADALINKAKKLGVDIDLSSFENTGDKLILTATEFNKYWEELNKANTKNIENWQLDINNARSLLGLGATTNIDLSTENARTAFKKININIEDYLDGNGRLTHDLDKLLELTELINNSLDALDNYSLATQIAADQLKNSYDRMRGVYKLSTENEEVLSDQDLRDIAKSTKLGKKDVSQRAIKESLNSVYDKLISDVLAKGFNNINPDDYEGLIADADGKVQPLIFDSYLQFVQDYVDFAGKTVEETNALIVQAIEKDLLQTMGAADIVRNFKFLDLDTAIASLKDLQSLADAFGVSLLKWIDNGALKDLLADGTYVFNTNELDGIDWDKISELDNIIADAVNEYFNSILDMMSKGLKGNLSDTDVTSLNESLERLGLRQLDTLTDFIAEGTEGLRLSLRAAIALYTELQKIDAYLSKLVFDDLRKSLEDSNESYLNVSSIMTHIRDLQNNINEANREKNSAKVEQYEQELAVAKEILAVRSQTDDDSFKFMDLALPSGQNNPLNYYDAMNKANKAISDAFNMGEGGGKGYMGYQDFYNIVTQINEMARTSGEKLKIGSYTLSGNMQEAADLIEAGAGALASVDGGEMKVNLGLLGIDMKTGASQMRNGLNSGLKTMAQEQIKMLDAAIAMLEAVVAMEDLGKLDTEGNGVIELDELGITIQGEDQFVLDNKKFKEAATAFKTVVEGMKATADEIFINGHSLSEIAKKILGITSIDELKSALGELGLSIEDLQSIFNNFYKLSKSEDWGKAGTDVISMIQDVFAGSGLSIDVNPFSKIKINYKDADVQKRINEIFKKKDGLSPEDQMKTLVKKAKKKPKDITWEDAYNLNYVAGKITVKKDKNGKEEYWYDGNKYNSQQEVGNVIALGAKFGASKVIARKDKKTGEITGYESTLSFLGVKYKVITDKNGKKISYEYNGQKDLTLSQVQLKIALDNFSKQLKGAKKTTTTIGEDDNREAVTYKMGSETITVVADDNGNIQYKGKDHKLYNSYNDMIDAEIRSEKGNENKKYISDKDREKYEIKIGYKITPTFENLNTDKLSLRNINNLKQATGEQLMAEWGQNSIEFQYKYGFKLSGPETVEDLLGLIDDLNAEDEEKTMKLNPKIVGDDADVAKKILDEKEIVVPVKLQVETEDNNLIPKSGEESVELSDKSSSNQTNSDQESKEKITELEAQLTEANTQLDTLTKDKTNLEQLLNEALAAKLKAEDEATRAWAELEVNTQISKQKSDEIIATVEEQLQAEINEAEARQTAAEERAKTAEEALTKEQNKSSELLQLLDAALKAQLKAEAEANKAIADLETNTQNAEQFAADTIQRQLELIQADIEDAEARKDAAEAKAKELELQIANKNVEIANLKNTITTLTTALSEALAKADAAVKAAQEAALAAKEAAEAKTSEEAKTKATESLEASKTATEYAENVQEIKQEVTPDLNTTDLDKAWNAWKQLMENDGIDIHTSTSSLFITWLQTLDENTLVELGIDSELAQREILQHIAILDDIPEEVKTKIGLQDDASVALRKILADIAALPPSKLITVTTKYTSIGETAVQATGNVALASGNSMASGTKTLMGELGPELVVSHGRYFVAGQNGAEFVDLDKDAIVFNHLQTQSLLKNGKAGRGKAKTNERNAVGMAAGNVSGPAKASAKATLNALKQLRAEWESIAKMSISDLASKGGGGGGGGGNKDAKNFIKELERWYNWLQAIDRLEKEINYQEKLRSKINSDFVRNGKAYAKSQKSSLGNIEKELTWQKSLISSQQDYFAQRRKELNNSAFKSLYTFGEKGQLEYSKGAFNWFSNLLATDKNGKPKYTAEELYKMILKKVPQAKKLMQYDTSGNKIDFKAKDGSGYVSAVQAFWDKIDKDQEEMQNLFDSIEEHEEAVLELEEKRNEIIKEMIDNRLDVENKVLDAVINERLKEIDARQKERDAYDKSTKSFIDGLNDALSKEQDMYKKREDDAELNKMRRQLAILQRSGGSATLISSLQKDIQGRELDQYFEERQAQIDAIQEASDKQIERMDHLIDIMTETLAYLKENGLLWTRVEEILRGNTTSINTFINNNSEEFQQGSNLFLEQTLNLTKSEIDLMKASADSLAKALNMQLGKREWGTTQKAFKEQYGKEKWYNKDVLAQAEAAYLENYGNTSDPNAAQEAAKKVMTKAKKAYDQKQAAEKAKKSSTNSNSKTSSNSNKNTSSSTKIKPCTITIITKLNGKTANTKTQTYTPSTAKSQVTLNARDYRPATPTGYMFANESPTSKAVWAGLNATFTYNYKEIKGYMVGAAGFAVGSTYKTSADAKKAAEAWAKKHGGKAIAYKHGGEVDYTGLAQVDGTPSRPEAFFNAELTKILKDGLLGSGSRLLASSLSELYDIIVNMSSGTAYSTIDRGEVISIENANVNMNIKELANDYDAKRAGKTALEEMVRIARKSGANNGVSRR